MRVLVVHQVELWTEDNARVEALSRVQLAAGTIWSRGAHCAIDRRVSAGAAMSCPSMTRCR